MSSCLLEENQSSTLVSCVPNIRQSARVDEAQENHTHESTNHKKKLKRVRPNHGLQPANGRVENADNRSCAGNNVKVDPGNLGKCKRWHVAEMKTESCEIRVEGNSKDLHNGRSHDQPADNIDKTSYKANVPIESLLEILKR